MGGKVKKMNATTQETQLGEIARSAWAVYQKDFVDLERRAVAEATSLGSNDQRAIAVARSTADVAQAAASARKPGGSSKLGYGGLNRAADVATTQTRVVRSSTSGLTANRLRYTAGTLSRGRGLASIGESGIATSAQMATSAELARMQARADNRQANVAMVGSLAGAVTGSYADANKAKYDIAYDASFLDAIRSSKK